MVKTQPLIAQADNLATQLVILCAVLVAAGGMFATACTLSGCGTASDDTATTSGSSTAAAPSTIPTGNSVAPPESPLPTPNSGPPSSRELPLFDRTLKCDLVEKLPEPPRLVIFGGSRAQRLSPATLHKLTGHPTFNFAVQNNRPEDAYAMARYLFDRAPAVKLRCLWALQVTTMDDQDLHAGLLTEPRLNRYLPPALIAAQNELPLKTKGRAIGPSIKFGSRGDLLHNHYDEQIAKGVPLQQRLDTTIRRMQPWVKMREPEIGPRAHLYFERTIELFNRHGVTPVLVIMPYQPRVLQAIRDVGWDRWDQTLDDYLARLRERYRFVLLDYSDLTRFGGDHQEYYDGAHMTASNSNRLLEQAVKDAAAALR